MPRPVTSSMCRPPTGTRPATSKKPKPCWAMTEAEVEQQLDLDVDQLMEFVETLDFDSVMESIEEQIHDEQEAKQAEQLTDQPIIETIDGSSSERLIVDQSNDESLADAINQHLDDTQTSNQPKTNRPSTSRPSTSQSLTRSTTATIRPSTAQPANQNNELITTLKQTNHSLNTIHSNKSLSALLTHAVHTTNQPIHQSTISLSTVRKQQAVVEEAQHKAEQLKVKQAADAAENAPDPTTSLKRLPMDPSRLPYLRRCPAV